MSVIAAFLLAELRAFSLVNSSSSLLRFPHGQILLACGFKFPVWTLLWANTLEANRIKNKAICLFANLSLLVFKFKTPLALKNAFQAHEDALYTAFWLFDVNYTKSALN